MHLAALVEEQPKSTESIYEAFQTKEGKKYLPETWTLDIIEQTSGEDEKNTVKVVVEKCKQLLIEALEFDLLVFHPYRELQL